MLYAPFRKGLLRREDECARPRSSSCPSCSDGLPCGRNAMALWRPEFDDPMAAAGFRVVTVATRGTTVVSSPPSLSLLPPQPLF